jgi:hypothetical protein
VSCFNSKIISKHNLLFTCSSSILPLNGVKSKSIQTSLYIDYLETNEFIFKTNHFHLCPIKKVIAENIKFQQINFAEDLDYSQKIVPLIQSYDFLEEEIYIYNDNIEKRYTRNF